MKSLDKSKLKDFDCLRTLQRQTEVMKLLSSDRHRNAHVVQLYDIYHTPSHILFRMEFAGSSSLYQRLAERERSGDRCRPLTAQSTRALVEQAVAAIGHLHTGPGVSHRDIKPENFVVNESGPGIKLQITDFDLSIIARPGAVCRDGCGTLPFAAPEVLLSRSYDPLAADIWSLGIVLLEVLCGVRVIERALKLQPREVTPAIMPHVRAFFGAADSVSRLLRSGCMPEAQALLEGFEPTLAGMLAVSPGSRLKAGDMVARTASSASQTPAPSPQAVRLPQLPCSRRGSRPAPWVKGATKPCEIDGSTSAATSCCSTLCSIDVIT